MIYIQNEDYKCFRWCLVRYLIPVNKNPARIRNVDKKFAKQLNFKNIKFPVHKKDYVKIEKQINISINVFGCEDEKLYRIYSSKQILKKNMLIYYYYQILKVSNIF